jgi:arsenate reductase
MTVTIYHNPRCGTSRTTLALLQQHGAAPVVIDYLKTPLDRKQLKELAKAIGGVRPLLREKEAVYGKLGLADPKLKDDALIDAIVAHPILLNRPIVTSPKGARVCRPSDLVLEIL